MVLLTAGCAARCAAAIAVALLSAGVSAAQAAQTRCGWLAMPTPGNLWLTDRDATWTLSSQGQALGPDAAGIEHLPAFDPRQFVETNVPGTGYGYGCACLVVDSDAHGKRITRVHSGRILPLSRCKSDKALPSPIGS